MKKIYIIFILLCGFINLNAQELEIKELIINKAILVIGDIMEEGITDGPVVVLNIEIKNNSNSDNLMLLPSVSKIHVKFTYEKIEYIDCYFGFSLIQFYETDTIIIRPHDSIQLRFSTPLFLGTKILKQSSFKRKSEYYNYTKELLQVLPTLRVFYQDTNIKLESTEIKNVVLSDTFEYTTR
jgi:hypothetical protein